MISRRNFLKIAGLSSIALSAGYSTGKFLNYDNDEFFIVHGFIPADENILSDLISSFISKVKANIQPAIFADEYNNQIIFKLHNQSVNETLKKSGKIIYRINKLNKNLDSDIIISDGNSPIYSIKDFNYSFYDIRNKIRNRKAEIIFTAEYKNENIFSQFFKVRNKELLIENHKGLVEKIPLIKNYKNITIDGIQGKTKLSLENGIAKVHSSACKNELCKHSIANKFGHIIACVPNNVIIKIV